MIISIDYDDTYTRDPLMWNWFAEEAMNRGHTVWCVSARHENYMSDAINTIGRVIGESMCVGTNGKPKRDYLYRNHGVYADVWIDDMPDTITGNFGKTDGGVWVTQFDGSATTKEHSGE